MVDVVLLLSIIDVYCRGAEFKSDIDMKIFEDLSPQVRSDIRKKCQESHRYSRGDFGEPSTPGSVDMMRNAWD